MSVHRSNKIARVQRPRSWAIAGAGAITLMGFGCQSQPTAPERADNPSLRHIAAPPGATRADADRAFLARFVGTWNFQGWSVGQGGERVQGSGRAAGVIEHDHFVLLDLETAVGELGGRTSRKSGSMILASEPGIGPTLTAWGDASPSISRSVGHIEGNGSLFSFTEAQTPAGLHRLAVTIRFETDDRWIAEIHDSTASGSPVVARYQFTRTGK
jgi:hypothetical protein